MILHHVALLIGGNSRRMGRNKAHLPWPSKQSVNGEQPPSTLTAHLIAVIQTAQLTPLLVGSTAKPQDVTADICHIADDGSLLTHHVTNSSTDTSLIKQGPLAGLTAALQYVQEPVMLLACDMPLVTTAHLDWLGKEWEQLCRRQPAALGLVGSTREEIHGTPSRSTLGRHQLQPCCAIYHPALLPIITTQMQNRRSLHGLIDLAAIPTVVWPQDLQPGLMNCNHPEQWDAAYARASAP